MIATKYPKPLIVIHWLTFFLLIIIFYIGTTFEDYEFNEANMNRYRLHAILGVSVMLLTLIRIYVRRKNLSKLPPHITYYSKMHKNFVTIVHYLLYILLIFAPMVGFVMVYQTGALSYDLGGTFPADAKFDHYLAELHEFAVFSLLALIIIHVAGVMMYKFKTGDNLIERMLP